MVMAVRHSALPFAEVMSVGLVPQRYFTVALPTSQVSVPKHFLVMARVWSAGDTSATRMPRTVASGSNTGQVTAGVSP